MKLALHNAAQGVIHPFGAVKALRFMFLKVHESLSILSGEKHIARQPHLYRMFIDICHCGDILDAVALDIEGYAKDGFELCVCTDFHGITFHDHSNDLALPTL